MLLLTIIIVCCRSQHIITVIYNITAINIYIYLQQHYNQPDHYDNLHWHIITLSSSQPQIIAYNNTIIRQTIIQHIIIVANNNIMISSTTTINNYNAYNSVMINSTTSASTNYTINKQTNKQNNIYIAIVHVTYGPDFWFDVSIGRYLLIQELINVILKKNDDVLIVVFLKGKKMVCS